MTTAGAVISKSTRLMDVFLALPKSRSVTQSRLCHGYTFIAILYYHLLPNGLQSMFMIPEHMTFNMRLCAFCSELWQ